MRVRPSRPNEVVPRITKFPLEDGGKVLDLMHTGKLRNRAVLVME